MFAFFSDDLKYFRMAVPDVVGVLCADSNGLCLTAQGTARSNSSGSLMALSRLAASIEPGTEDPVLLFDGPDRQCAVRRNAGVTLAIYKEKGQRAEPPQ